MWICCDHNIDGEVVEERFTVRMESRVLMEYQNLKEEDGHNTNIDLSRLDEGI